ncbi:hypothetical protein [Thermocrinis sp.]
MDNELAKLCEEANLQDQSVRNKERSIREKMYRYGQALKKLKENIEGR